MREIEPMDVAAAKPAEIADANAVENRTAGRILVDDISDRRRADKEPVVVIVQAGIVLVPGGDKLCLEKRNPEDRCCREGPAGGGGQKY